MAEWLLERGIGEDRAILVEDDVIVEAEIELPGPVRPGAVVGGRLGAVLANGRQAMVETDDGAILVEQPASGPTEGAAVHVEVTRAPIAEPGRARLARGRITTEPLRPGPPLAERIAAATPLRPTDPDRFEATGWSELLEEARTGEIPFPGGALRLSLTPAMTLFDVDGTLPPAELAVAGAAAAGRAIRRMGIGGSIGIDLPTLPSRGERQRAAAALDEILPQPFERTAVNGFGFLQVVRRRARESLPELVRFDPVGAAARALLRRAERVTGAGARELIAAPAVIARIEATPGWLSSLARSTGTEVRLRADPALTTWGGHVQSVQS